MVLPLTRSSPKHGEGPRLPSLVALPIRLTVVVRPISASSRVTVRELRSAQS